MHRVIPQEDVSLGVGVGVRVGVRVGGGVSVVAPPQPALATPLLPLFQSPPWRCPPCAAVSAAPPAGPFPRATQPPSIQTWEMHA